MATITPTTQQQFANALQNAGNSDIVQLPAGSVFNGVGFNGRQNLTIRSVDPSDPGTINDELTVTNSPNLVIEDVKFLGSELYGPAPTWNGLPIPGGIALRCDRVSGLEVRNCEFKFYRNPIAFKGGNTRQTNILVEFCDFRQIGMDGITLATPTTGFTLRRCSFAGEQVNADIYLDLNQHPDAWQGWLNGNNAAHENILIEENHFELFRQKAIWFGPGTSPLTYTYKNVTIRGNFARSGRLLVIAFNFVDGLLCEDNTVKSTAALPPEVNQQPALCMGENLKDIVVRNNFIPRAIQWYTAFKQADVVGTATFTNNQIKGVGDTTWAGLELIPGTNVGRVVAGEVAPTQPTVAATHGAWGAWEELGTGVFLRPLVVPTGSFAFDSAGLPATKTRWRHTSAGVTGWQPFAFAGLDGSGGRRLFPTIGGQNYTAGYSATQSGIEWSYQLVEGTLWSEPSSYTSDATAAPAEPPPTELSGLTAPQWAIVGHDVEAPGFFIPIVRTVPGAPAPLAVQWTTDTGGSPTWQPTVASGIDGDGRVLWLLQPGTPGAQTHIVPYDGTLEIGIRYNDGETNSEVSVDRKTYTAPAAPLLPVGLEPGDRIYWNDEQVTISRRRLMLGPEGMPAAVSFLDVLLDDDVISVETQVAPPAGATRIEAIYAGSSYPVVDGAASFPAVVGFSVVAVRGVSAVGVGGRERFAVLSVPS